jgi:hypothetical protein
MDDKTRSVLVAAYGVIQPHLDCLIECHCILDPETHEPRRETLDPEVREEVALIEQVQASIKELLNAQ